MSNPYLDHGYDSREDYIEALADQAGAQSELVHIAADLFGPSEDFDGLLTTLQDYGIEVEP